MLYYMKWIRIMYNNYILYIFKKNRIYVVLKYLYKIKKVYKKLRYKNIIFDSCWLFMVNGVIWVFVGFVVFVIIVSYFGVEKDWLYFWYVLFKGLYFV